MDYADLAAAQDSVMVAPLDLGLVEGALDYFGVMGLPLSHWCVKNENP